MSKPKVIDEVEPDPEAFPTAEPFLPDRITLPNLRKAVQNCKGCDLFKNAPQAVVGEGDAKAAGKLLDRALSDAGIERERIYVTSAVTDFKNEMCGKRHLHRSPNIAEITPAARSWSREVKVTGPKVIICMGVSAARSVFGRTLTLRDVRGKFIPGSDSEQTLVTMHPSSILRSPDDESRHRNYAAFVADLKVAAGAL